MGIFAMGPLEEFGDSEFEFSIEDDEFIRVQLDIYDEILSYLPTIPIIDLIFWSYLLTLPVIKKIFCLTKLILFRVWVQYCHLERW